MRTVNMETNPWAKLGRSLVFHPVIIHQAYSLRNPACEHLSRALAKLPCPLPCAKRLPRATAGDERKPKPGPMAANEKVPGSPRPLLALRSGKGRCRPRAACICRCATGSDSEMPIESAWRCGGRSRAADGMRSLAATTTRQKRRA